MNVDITQWFYIILMKHHTSLQSHFYAISICSYTATEFVILILYNKVIKWLNKPRERTGRVGGFPDAGVERLCCRALDSRLYGEQIVVINERLHQADDVVVPGRLGAVRRRRAVLVPGTDVGASSKQQLDHVELSLYGGVVQCRPTVSTRTIVD